MQRGAVSNAWLDEATLPYVTWIMSVRYFQPDIFCHECVPNFPSNVFDEILNDGKPQLKDVYSLEPQQLWFDAQPLDDDKDLTPPPSEWSIITEVFSPEDLGCPVRRRRRYSAGFWSPRCQTLRGLSLSDFCFRRLACDGTVFLQADPVMVSGGSSFSGISFLEISQEFMIASQVNRLEGRLFQAFRAGFCDSDFKHWTVPFAIVDLTQSEAWRGIDTQVLPTQLRKSKLWDLVTARLVGEAALWLSQGFAHPEAIGLPKSMTGRFPFQMDVFGSPQSSTSSTSTASTRHPSLALSERLAMAGNAMNVMQVSAWIAFVLAHLRSVSPDADVGMCSDNVPV